MLYKEALYVRVTALRDENVRVRAKILRCSPPVFPQPLPAAAMYPTASAAI
jgi:hypothetical protein